MLTREENELLTRVGPGSRMGELFRSFWLPALLSEELPQPDCPPVRLRIVSEDLIAFRDTMGRVGLIEAYCAHRGGFLYWGRNEHCGLRCTYHGWKFDVEGRCVDMPTEAPGSSFKDKVRIRSYPTCELGGIVWAYMGAQENIPEIPDFEWMHLPETHRHVSKWLQESNWLQGLEGEMDTSHASLLHRFTDSPGAPDYQRRAIRMEALYQDTAPRIAVKETDYGFVYGGRRDAGQGEYYWRVMHWLLPTFSLIPAPEYPMAAGRAWIPIDDEHTFTFSYTFHPERPLTDEEVGALKAGVRFPPELDRSTYRLEDGYVIDTWRPKRNRENNYLIDREIQRSRNYTGIHGINDQDRSIQETIRSYGGKWGAIADRTRERLGSTDLAIIAIRQRLLAILREMQKGNEPMPIPGALYNRRPLDVVSHQAQFADLLEENKGIIRS